MFPVGWRKLACHRGRINIRHPAVVWGLYLTYATFICKLALYPGTALKKRTSCCHESRRQFFLSLSKLVRTCDKYHVSRTCHIFLLHFVTFPCWLGVTLSITANSSQQQVVLVYVWQTSANRTRIRTASSIQQQHAACSSSKQCGKQHTVTASNGAKAVYSNSDNCSKPWHKQLRAPTASNSDTQVLLLYEVYVQ